MVEIGKRPASVGVLGKFELLRDISTVIVVAPNNIPDVLIMLRTWTGLNTKVP